MIINFYESELESTYNYYETGAEHLLLLDRAGNVTPYKIPTLKSILEWGKDKVVFNFDNKYMIFVNLAAVLETGWAHGDFQESVWGRRLAEKSRSGDAWKVAFGLTYKF